MYEPMMVEARLIEFHHSLRGMDHKVDLEQIRTIEKLERALKVARRRLRPGTAVSATMP